MSFLRLQDVSEEFRSTDPYWVGLGRPGGCEAAIRATGVKTLGSTDRVGVLLLKMAFVALTGRCRRGFRTSHRIPSRPIVVRRGSCG